MKPARALVERPYGGLMPLQARSSSGLAGHRPALQYAVPALAIYSQ
jgi:hypothetical protein